MVDSVNILFFLSAPLSLTFFTVVIIECHVLHRQKQYSKLQYSTGWASDTEARADRNKKDETCALYNGIQLPSVDMCKDLFKHGCDPNTKVDSDLVHYKAIHFATYFGATSCLVQFLVYEDADIICYHDILLYQLFQNNDAKILKYCPQNDYSRLGDNMHCWYNEFVGKEMRGCATTLGVYTCSQSTQTSTSAFHEVAKPRHINNEPTGSIQSNVSPRKMACK